MAEVVMVANTPLGLFRILTGKGLITRVVQGRGPSLARDGLVLYIRRFELITSFIYLFI